MPMQRILQRIAAGLVHLPSSTTLPNRCRPPHSTFTPVAATTRVHFSTSAAI